MFMKKKIIIISTLVLLIDQLSKILVGININLNDSIIINNFFSLTNVYNEGAAFSILKGQRLIFIIIGFIMLIIIYNYIKDFKNNIRNVIAFSLLIGGITGNLLDRIFLGYVRDFLDFKIIGWDYPVFNIGDSAIFMGIILLIIAIFKGEENGSTR